MTTDTLRASRTFSDWIPASWAYPETGATRDLRFDYMRGFVIPLLFATHFDFFSLLMFVGWERIGIVSTAEIFVILSGVVVGMVYGKKVKRDGLPATMPGLIQRSVDLYRISVVMILLVAAIRYVPWIDSTVITTFFDAPNNQTYQLYPPLDGSLSTLISKALLLQIGPHQFQVIGMYVVMFILITPLVFFMLSKQRVWLLLGISWVVYAIHYGAPFQSLRPTGAQFEYAFPIMAWQLIYVHGIVVGYYKQEVVAFFRTVWGKWLIVASVLLSLGFMFLTWNHPLPHIPQWITLNMIPAETFHYLNNEYFSKSKIGIGRLLNVVVLFISIYALLTLCWQPLNRALGWFFIPLGQASLYVFFIHVFLLLAIMNTPLPGYKDFWINTALHIGLLAVVWVMVKKEFLFRWIPH
ncbi:OpgC domain-containing protein [Thiothrix winogradskyi]|uniref:OpgC domain-containing protein n=1 Tax=Thiothrix winogradskyi TaxID=96472 RepID=A0ABY3SZ04_9GAMM|nr:OpgC domain-containing protein [Thiothrix winogradskyi]UJS23726.1 OpgC domain-containing protein [Thiothrix winogradskyi]